MTLGMIGVVQGLILAYTGGQAEGRAAPALTSLVNGRVILDLPGLLFLWLLLGLLALAGIIALIAGLAGGDDDSASTGGGLRAGNTQLLPVPGDGLGSLVGQTVQGREVVVQSVVRGQEDPDALEGFWVGSGNQDRVYVEWGGDVGSNEADYTPKVGEKVDLTGPVRPAPQDPERTLNLEPADAELVRSQGGYVNADEVKPSS
jgi:hypothetical protein